MNEEILLSYTKVPKNHIQNILEVDPSQQPSQRMSRYPQILRREFLPLPDNAYAAVQRSCRLLQQFPLPRPADQAALA
jgi:hypothetical protein